MSNNPYESPDNAGQAPPRKHSTLTRTLVTLVAFVVGVGLFIALLIPSVRSAPEAARRASCSVKLKNIALALQAYESDYHALPPAYTVDAEGKPLHSWRTLILPYLGQKALYDKINLSKAWDDPANKDSYETTLSIYRCPSAVSPADHTSYLAVVAPEGCFRPTEPRKLTEITDDPGLTLMVVEADSEYAVHWMSPVDINEARPLTPEVLAKGPHHGFFQAAFVDGNVRTLSSNLTPETLHAMISVAGHDDDIPKEVN